MNKIILLPILIIFIGCFDENVRKYTKEHPGVTCESIGTVKSMDGHYKNGFFKESEYIARWKCSDGVIINQIFD